MSAVSQPQPIAGSAATVERSSRLVFGLRAVAEWVWVLANAPRLLEGPVVALAMPEDDYLRFTHRRPDTTTREIR